MGRTISAFMMAIASSGLVACVGDDPAEPGGPAPGTGGAGASAASGGDGGTAPSAGGGGAAGTTCVLDESAIDECQVQ